MERKIGFMAHFVFDRGRLFQRASATPLPEWAAEFDAKGHCDIDGAAANADRCTEERVQSFEMVGERRPWLSEPGEDAFFAVIHLGMKPLATSEAR